MAERQIRRAAVLGAGVMGASIAAHLANVGVPVYLMDIVPKELTPEETKKGLTMESPAVRNRLAQQGKDNLLKQKPAPLYQKSFADLITVGNFEDNLDWISECDWVIEVIVENMDIKKKFFQNVEKNWKPGTIVSSNTSGLSINEMVGNTSQEFQQHFLGTHFFNPPRYMKLLEIIPHQQTRQDIIDYMTRYCERVLGKGVVFAKDTPNFIANRLGTHSMMATLKVAMEEGLSIEEIDGITGVPMGNPKTATFRTADMVGLDTFYHVVKTVYEATEDPKEKDVLEIPDFLEQMVQKGWIGDKAKQGFYKKEKTSEGTKRYALDYHSLEYRERQKAKFDAVSKVKDLDLHDRLLKLYEDDSQVGSVVRKIVKASTLFAASKIPEIADDIVNVDRGVKWGFNRRVGPFEMFDAIGVKKIVDDAKKDGDKIPPIVEALLEKGYESFYMEKDNRWYFFDLNSKDYQPVPFSPEEISLPSLKKQTKLIKEEPSGHASLIDLGDGITCLEMTSPRQAISPEFIDFMFEAVEETEKNFTGMVVTNQEDNFCVGANVMMVLMAAQAQQWDQIDSFVKKFQDACMHLKYSRIPVVAAPFSMTLGGGMEICAHANRVHAAAETYMGQVELGVGLIPGGGGNKELLIRHQEGIPDAVKVDLLPFVQKVYEYIMMATVATSANEAKAYNFLRPTDKISVNRDFLIHDAKNTVLAMLQEGWEPPREKPITVTGKEGMGALLGGIKVFEWGGYITEHERLIGEKLAYALTGGYIEPKTKVSEQFLLDVERRAFLELCAESKTHERIQHMLTAGKPLRN